MPNGMSHAEAAEAAIDRALNTTDLGERQARIAEAQVHALLAIAEKLEPAKPVELTFGGFRNPVADEVVDAHRRSAAHPAPFTPGWKPE